MTGAEIITDTDAMTDTRAMVETEVMMNIHASEASVCMEDGTVHIADETQHAIDQKFMKAAIVQARKAEKLDEVPIGCVIVYEGKIIARGYNRRNTDKNTISHAEMNAIRKASRKLGDWRLEGCTIYITLEPCQMCSGAIVQSRIDRCVIGAMNPKAGCAGSVLNMLQVAQFNHQVEITKGILEEECSSMLSTFFRNLRSRGRMGK